MAPTFVLVPGHWHTKAHMQPLAKALETRGHTSRIVQLHSVGRKSPRPTFADDVSVIYSAVSSEIVAGKDVCLVLHSAASMPGAEAINRLIADGALEGGGGKLSRVVFIAAYVFPAGVVMDAKAFVRPEDPGYSIDVRLSRSVSC